MFDSSTDSLSMISNNIKSNLNNEECNNSIDTSTSIMSGVVESNESTSSSSVRPMLLSHSSIQNCHSIHQNQISTSPQNLYTTLIENYKNIQEHGDQRNFGEESETTIPNYITKCEESQNSDLMFSNDEPPKEEAEKSSVRAKETNRVISAFFRISIVDGQDFMINQ